MVCFLAEYEVDQVGYRGMQYLCREELRELIDDLEKNENGPGYKPK